MLSFTKIVATVALVAANMFVLNTANATYACNGATLTLTNTGSPVYFYIKQDKDSAPLLGDVSLGTSANPTQLSGTATWTVTGSTTKGEIFFSEPLNNKGQYYFGANGVYKITDLLGACNTVNSQITGGGIAVGGNSTGHTVTFTVSQET